MNRSAKGNRASPGLFTSVTLLTLSLLCACVHTKVRSFPDAAELPSKSGLPDPLVTFSGRTVSTPQQWFSERRPELKALFDHYMYGAIPPKPPIMQVRRLGEYHDFLQGKATLKLRRLEIGPGRGPRIDLMLV